LAVFIGESNLYFVRMRERDMQRSAGKRKDGSRYGSLSQLRIEVAP
jgi:hypothetical protein